MRRGVALLTLAVAAAVALVYLSAAFFGPHSRAATPQPEGAAASRPVADAPDAVRMEVKGVSLDPATSAPMVILVDQDERRVLPIFIGPAEATSIARQLGDLTTARPLTHDLILNILGQLDAEVTRVLISDVREGTYYAVLFLKTNGQDVPVDSRPSDAIAVALRAGAPIFVTQKVLLDSPQMNLEDLEILTGESGMGHYVASLGMSVQELTPDLAAVMGYAGREKGALVGHVDEDGVARNAGIMIGDLILKLDDADIADAKTFRSAARSLKAGSATITLLRGDKERRITVDLGD
jgi:bifunctional DNase/RNase